MKRALLFIYVSVFILRVLKVKTVMGNGASVGNRLKKQILTSHMKSLKM